MKFTITLAAIFMSLGIYASECKTDLMYAYTHSALVYINNMETQSFNEAFLPEVQTKKSREEIARDVKLKPIFDRAMSRNSLEVGLNIPLVLYAVYLDAQAVVKDKEDLYELIAISGKHFSNENSTWGDYVSELESNSILNFSICE